jgi:hypothetical protein
MTMPRATILVHVSEMKNMNRCIEQNEQSETIARAIVWEEGKAIMGTDGSVRDPTATYSFVISFSRTDVKTNVRGGGFLPPTAQYLDPYSKRPEAAALLAGLTWIQNLLRKFPNHTDTTDSPPLLIPVNNDGVVKDVHRTINAQTPTYNLISPNFDILQAIQTTVHSTNYRSEWTLRTFIMDTKTDTSCGTNLTSVRKSMYLLIDKLTPSTRNPNDGLDCSQHGSLAPELLYFTVNNKLPKASLSTFGMQLTRQH